MMLTQLAGLARRTGCPVIEVPGWQDRGRPGGMGDIRTITVHHTANGGAPGDYPSLGTVRDGRPDLPGPLAQLGLGTTGIIYVIAAGRCNHAGESLRSDYENPHAIGIEAEAVGIPGMLRDWPDRQMDSFARLCAVLVDAFDLSVEDVRGHKETCFPHGRKADPSFGMDAFRARVAAVNLKTAPAQEDDMKLTDEVDLTPKAAELLKAETATVRDLLQWPPAVRAARNELEVVRTEQAEQSRAVILHLAAQGAALSAISDTLKEILARLPVDPGPGK